ncbi:MAG: dodecin domain-containing protein, partial [Actinomycetales bacterium]|nr:dodecin domain-containing protein [Actinomycetales bacterium]
MSQRTYGLTEVVGTSSTGIDDAIHSAIGRASKTVRH